jgi:hypothetical protein
MVFQLEVFGNNDLFKHVTDIHLLKPYMYTSGTSPPSTVPIVLSNESFGLRPSLSGSTNKEGASGKAALELKENNIVLPTSETNMDVTGVKPPKQTMPGIFPRKPDNLFWCVYIALYGYDTYHEIGHRYGNIEIEEKQKMVEQMKKSPAVAKQSPKKITKVLFQEIMSDFMTNKKVTMDMLTMMALYHNKNFMIAHLTDSGESEPYYITIFGDESRETPPCLIYKRGKYDFSLMLNPETTLIEDIVNKQFKYENHDMPLRAVSTYKTADLEHIFDVLGLEKEKGKRYKKEDYYKSVMLRCGFV